LAANTGGRSFAIIIDEAHTGQGGRASAALSMALAEGGAPVEDETTEDRINRISFTLKERQLTRADLDDFVARNNPTNRHECTETERFRPFTYQELTARDKASLDIFWLRDKTLEDTDNLPPPHVIAAEIVEDLETALAQFAEIAETLAGDRPG